MKRKWNRLTGSRKYPISIIACDLDDLKLINDKFGHDAGDKAIKAAAKVLGLHAFRKEDVVARIGGDEFIIILPSVDLNENQTIVDRLNTSIEQFNTNKIDDDLYRPIGMSIGFAVVYQDGSLEEGYKQADAAMYKVKSQRKTQA